MKPYSDACERNKVPLQQQLLRLFSKSNSEKNNIAQRNVPRDLLEIGSGTGQHAVFFSKCFSNQPDNIRWQPSDIAENIAGINAWREAEGNENCLEPILLNLETPTWQKNAYHFVFTANTLHIIRWELVEKLFAGASNTLLPQGLFIVYGPFNYANAFTSESNKQFDGWLKNRDIKSGIRDIEAVAALAQSQPFPLILLEDIEMPANNRLLVFQKY